MNLYNISYDAREQDIKNHYYGVKIAIIEKVSKGTFTVEFDDIEEAIKFVNFKETVYLINFLYFKIKIYYNYISDFKRQTC